jgi:MFS family permease
LFIFWHYEQWIIKQGKEPLFIPALFESPGLVRGLMAAFFYNAFATFFLIFSIYEQAARGSNPLQAGLAVLPLGIGYALSPLLSPWLIRVAGNRAVTYATLLLAGGMFCTAATASIGTSWTLIPSLFLIGLGQGLGLPTLIRTVVERVDGRWAGLGAGLVNSVLQISGSLSVALIGGLFYMVLPNQISPNAITHAFSISASAIGLSLVVSAALVNSVGSIYTRNTLTDGEIHH